MMPMIRRRKLARFVDVYCDSGAFTLNQSRRYLENARGLGFGLKMHAEQFARSGAARLAVVLEAASADHLEQAGEEDIGAFAAVEHDRHAAAGFVFSSGSAQVCTRARVNRSRRGSGPGNRFQSRHQPDVQYADGAFAGVHGNAHVAR